MTDIVLELQSLDCAFGGLRAVAELGMQIRRGAITALIGPNGAGKSTVINLLSGLLSPSGGRILLEGVDVTGASASQLAKAGIVRTFQNGRLFKRLSVFENALVGRSAHTKASIFDTIFRTRRFSEEERELKENASAYLVDLGLIRDADRIVTELSYGKQRQVEFVRALMGSPRVLLLDEPAAGLNSAEQAELSAYLRKLRDRGLTILLVEHHMGVVMPLADHVVVLNFGKKIFEGTATQTQNSEIVADAYLGRRGRGNARH